MSNLTGDPRTFILVLIAIGFAIQQITVGHNLDVNTALTLFVGGLGAGGVSVAHTAGVNAATHSDRRHSRCSRCRSLCRAEGGRMNSRNGAGPPHPDTGVDPSVGTDDPAQREHEYLSTNVRNRLLARSVQGPQQDTDPYARAGGRRYGRRGGDCSGGIACVGRSK